MMQPRPYRHIEWESQPTIIDQLPAPRERSESVAIIVGGAELMRIELDRALALCHGTGKKATIYLVNDAIHEIGFPAIGCTLHPYDRKLGKWIRLRAEAGHPALTEVWAQQPGPFVTNRAGDPKGSTSLFATEVALHYKGHDKAILCGVPMTPDGGHFLRKQPWTHAAAWRLAWLPKLPRLRRHVRSFSGWTMEMLGLPDPTFLETGP